ncbi:hypothetical protein LMG27952_02619 [Paraburkholderia hiiakae]|uniref:Integrase n=1 Tax=Paraburkholderia hiiakae TaxID=1081782 RepID=A0ABM8NLM9_9BURK|nr:hypothetical protein [Paraburkholderia hiiakae]CAD6531762.1 hypothetical protein LMG27952_02619 [Paraburkholderia hiiakae]
MAISVSLLRLAIESPLAVPGAPNFRPPKWPPNPDWPVVVGPGGEVVSRWGDPIWRLDPWAGRPIPINFGDGPRGRIKIDPANADLLRILAGWWLYGRNGVRSPQTFRVNFGVIRPLFELCSREGISAADLARYPRTIEQLLGLLKAGSLARLLPILHACYEQRDLIGYTLLDRAALARFAASVPDHEKRQTLYIPPRIWRYQVMRLRECLDDFLAHKEKVQECFEFCLQAYARNFGAPAVASSASWKAPFQQPKRVTGGRSRKTYLGPFALTAKKFGIDELLLRWVDRRARKSDSVTLGVDSFSKYLTLVSRVGLAYVTNFSLMRVDEAWNLRTDCLKVEHDPNLGSIYTLCGPTTKTLHAERAVWITSPSAKVAVDAMSVVARLRSACAKLHPTLPPDHIEASDIPFLQTYVYEPWATGREGNWQYQVRRDSEHYRSIVRRYPKLFDVEALRITQRDIELARLVTPTIDSSIYAVGRIWRFTWHQLRRTGAVNMQASGLVSDASLQFQLKHVTRAMSLYYGRGFSRVRLEEGAETLYVRTLYETLGRELSQLADDRFVSPHGEKRKQEIVRFIDPNDAKKLAAFARQGAIGCREIILGYCTYRDPCPYGGVDSVAHCGGGDEINGKACPDVLYDAENCEQVKNLDRLLGERLLTAPDGSPLRDSLEAQRRSIRNYLNAIDSTG